MNTFTTTAYNTLGQAVEHETINDSWKATETCLDFSMLYGYAETTALGVATTESMATDPQH